MVIGKFALYGVLGLSVAGFLTGCANVEPWDRNILAKDNMTIMPDPSGAELSTHINESREGTAGATSVGGGGCGCN